jgi:hypothetical protein
VVKRTLPYQPADAARLSGRCFGPDDRGLSDTTYGPAISDGTLGALVGLLRADGSEVHAHEIAALPADPDQLSQVFRQWGATSPADEWGDALGLLALPELPGDVAAAVYELVSREPGLTLRPGVTDRLGRQATAIDLPDHIGYGVRSSLYFDPTTGGLLSSETTAAGPHRVGAGVRTLPDGTVLYATTILSQGSVTADGARP